MVKCEFMADWQLSTHKYTQDERKSTALSQIWCEIFGSFLANENFHTQLD